MQLHISPALGQRHTGQNGGAGLLIVAGRTRLGRLLPQGLWRVWQRCPLPWDLEKCGERPRQSERLSLSRDRTSFARGMKENWSRGEEKCEQRLEGLCSDVSWRGMSVSLLTELRCPSQTATSRLSRHDEGCGMTSRTAYYNHETILLLYPVLLNIQTHMMIFVE